MTHATPLAPDVVIARNPDLITSNLEGDTVMMSMASGNYYGLNAVGSRIWELLEQPMSARALNETLLTEFDVDEVTCRNHVNAFVAHLLDEKLVTVTSVK